MANANHCSFILLAEFDIDQGAQLTYQFPQPLGTDESLLATSMLPDGAEKQLEDWTIFFLNQTPFNTISPVLALETPEVNEPSLESEGSERPDLLYVLNLVRTRHDKAKRRGAEVKAMAICTRYPYIQIFKPILLLALDDYFANPSQDHLARLFDAINSMDLSGMPYLTRHEKMIMRTSERKDIFAEKFTHTIREPTPGPYKTQHRPTNSGESVSSFEEGILLRGKEQDAPGRRERAGTTSSSASSNQHGVPQESPSDSSFSLGGSLVWVGEDSVGSETAAGSVETGSTVSLSTNSSTLVSGRGRRSTDASASSSSSSGPSSKLTISAPSPLTKDTHFFNTTLAYKGIKLPIKLPLATFAEEVGDYSLIPLIKMFSSHQLVSGPIHPHLHSSGPQTHPIILLFNALVTGKRIIFMGHGRPAGQVSGLVLSACAIGSGCGVVLRGFIERAFPYASLKNKDEWESIPAYIAGVTNLIFKTSGTWDILFDVATGQVLVHKDIHARWPASAAPAIGATPLVARSGTIKVEVALPPDEDAARSSVPKDSKDASTKADFAPKNDNADNVFIEDIRSAIEYHFGEGMVRMRFTEYVTRFVRLASRYEEETLGKTKIGYPTASFTDVPRPRLGSGMVFTDDASAMRELTANAYRMEAWRNTNTYANYVVDFAKAQASSAIKSFDVLHQLFRLRQAKNMSDTEVELIVRTIANNVRTYEQVVELLAYLAPHGGGLLYLSFGLFHQQEVVRDLTVDIFNELRSYAVGVTFLQALNHFQRYSYVRQAHARESRVAREQQQQLHPPPVSYTSRTPSNRSDASLV
ncbi:hypothetical protein EYR38_002128 [Pleurotus pulmonarius]|nr:hypothetical protein EYR38_002128 [Pleurotus pulmonarius]